MSNLNLLDDSIPVAPISLIVHESASSLGKNVDRIISSRRKKQRDELVNNL